MKKILLMLTIFSTFNLAIGQKEESLDHCGCSNKIDQITPFLNGSYSRYCNNILIEKGAFKNGLKDGEWLTYSTKGKLIRMISYDSGTINGKVELYYLSGKLKLAGQFENGKKTGSWSYFNAQGKKLVEGNYEANKPIGIWTVYNKTGKKAVVKYDYYQRKSLINRKAPKHKSIDFLQNPNTEYWFVYYKPALIFTSNTTPFGGFDFANYMFAELVEVPTYFWHTYLYRTYKVNYKISADNEMSFSCEKSDSFGKSNSDQITFLIVTDDTPKIETVDHTELELKLLDYKINEALNLMPPWVFKTETEVAIYLHYAINKNLHR